MSTRLAKSAFTLIKLLLVVIAIGILATLALLTFERAKDRAKFAEAWRSRYII